MARTLDTLTLDSAAQYYAGLFVLNSGTGKFGRGWIMGQFHDFHFKDEFDYLIGAVRDELGKSSRDDFDGRIAKLHKDKPREQKVFEKLLADKLAITPNGEHIEGKIGSVQIGARTVGSHDVELETPDSTRWRKVNGIISKANRKTYFKQVRHEWPIYAGEAEERERPNGGAATPFPLSSFNPTAALAFNMSAAAAIAAVDAVVDLLDGGASNAVIECRDGAQPVDPDAGTTGTLAASLAMTDPAFGAASDQAPGAQAAAATISDDVSVDATVTVGYCRVSTTTDGLTPVTPVLDGSAGVGTFDFNWNTVAFVSGATASISAYLFDQSQGTTAT